MEGKRIFVIVLFIFGIVLISVSTFNFIYSIPKIDSELNEKENKLEHKKRSHLLHEVTKNFIMVMENQMFLANKTDPKSDYSDKIESDIEWNLVNKLHYFYEGTGEPLNITTQKKWFDMNESELRTEYDKILRKYAPELGKTYTYSKYYDEIKELKEKKQNILFWSSIFQVLGLLVNQTAIILDILWRNQEH